MRTCVEGFLEEWCHSVIGLPSDDNGGEFPAKEEVFVDWLP